MIGSSIVLVALLHWIRDVVAATVGLIACWPIPAVSASCSSQHPPNEMQGRGSGRDFRCLPLPSFVNAASID